jgi:hypothetical protein
MKTISSSAINGKRKKIKKTIRNKLLQNKIKKKIKKRKNRK